MVEDKKKIEPEGIDSSLLRAGEAVSRLAIELAKLEASDGERPDVDNAVTDAWRLLRRACLEIETYRGQRTIEDYKRFGIRPPREFLEALKPPPPPPYREPFETLFHKNQATIYLPSKAIQNSTECFEWQQLVPWDAVSQPASAERKTTPYKIAWSVIEPRVCQKVDEILSHIDLVNHLCDGFEWRWDWDELPVWTAKKVDQRTGIFEPWINRAEWEGLAKCANELPRPHNRSVEAFFSHRIKDDSFEWEQKLRPGSDKGLPGPTPSDETPLEELYEQARTWAGAVIKAWKNEFAQMKFDAFWSEGKEQGFLWEDVKAMALHTKKHKGAIKWHSGKRPQMSDKPNGKKVEGREG